jgi:hypothetical protein
MLAEQIAARQPEAKGRAPPWLPYPRDPAGRRPRARWACQASHVPRTTRRWSILVHVGWHHRRPKRTKRARAPVQYRWAGHGPATGARDTSIDRGQPPHRRAQRAELPNVRRGRRVNIGMGRAPIGIRCAVL